jgi:hypothetical protein
MGIPTKFYTILVRKSIRPDRLWGPSSLVCNEYWASLPRVKLPGSGLDQPPPSSAKAKERVQQYTSTPRLGLRGLFQGELHVWSEILKEWYYLEALRIDRMVLQVNGCRMNFFGAEQGLTTKYRGNCDKLMCSAPYLTSRVTIMTREFLV